MTWNDFTNTEKIAIFKSAIAVARCNYNSSLLGSLIRRSEPKHELNYSQNLYLNMLFMRMNRGGDPKSFTNAALSMQDKVMANTIKQMSREKRDFVFLIWCSILCRISNSTFMGSMSMSDFPSEYNSVVKAMANDMNITIQSSFEMDEFGYF